MFVYIRLVCNLLLMDPAYVSIGADRVESVSPSAPSVAVPAKRSVTRHWMVEDSLLLVMAVSVIVGVCVYNISFISAVVLFSIAGAAFSVFVAVSLFL